MTKKIALGAIRRGKRHAVPLKGRTPFVSRKTIEYRFPLNVTIILASLTKQMEEALPAEALSRVNTLGRIDKKICAWRDSNARPIP